MVALLLLIVTLTAPFGVAEARAIEADPNLVIEVTVGVTDRPTAVLFRGVSVVGELAPVAMDEVEPGRWGAVVRLIGKEDLAVGFEAIYPDGTTEISELTTLIELGVDPAVFLMGSDPSPPEDGEGFTIDVWLAVAIAAAVLAVVAVAVWATVGVGVDKSSANADHTENTDERSAGGTDGDDDEPGSDGEAD